MIFISNHNSPEVLKSGKKVLHLPSTPIRSQFASILGFRFLAPFSMRRNHFDISFIKQSLIQILAIIFLVTDKFIGGIFGKITVDGFFNQCYFMGRSAFNVSGDRKTRSVCDCHDLGAFATLCLADSKTPFFAGVKQPSMEATRISIWPPSYRSSTNSCAMPLKTPCSTHRWNHRWQVWYGGYRWGISFQDPPVRRIHKMPLITSRRSRVGRPLGSFGGVNSLTIGSNRFHFSFVMSILNSIANSGCNVLFFHIYSRL